MAGSVRKEIWEWKGISGVKKHVSLIHLATFWVAWMEGTGRAFEGIKVNFGRIKDIFCTDFH